MDKIGFIGLGNMGLPMAVNLKNQALEVKAYDLSEEAKVKAIESGIEVKNSIQETSEGIDALITMLPNDSAVEEVYLNSSLLDDLAKTTLIIDSSTISPETSKRVANRASKVGISMLDAPVSGGVKGAVDGTLSFIVGGKDEDLVKASSLFDIMGSNTFHAGDSGSGQIAKLCNNMLLAIHMCGTAETIAMGVKNGLDPEVLSEIMKKSSGGNWSLEKYNPFPGVMKDAPAGKNYSGGFLNLLMLKDLSLAQELASLSNSETPMGKLAKELYEELNNQGMGGLDFSSIQKRYIN